MSTPAPPLIVLLIMLFLYNIYLHFCNYTVQILEYQV